MPFIVEEVSEADIKKYDLRAINEKHCKADFGYEWVRDSDRDIYLRFLTQGHHSASKHHEFSFFWKGNLLSVRLDKETEVLGEAKGKSTWKFVGWDIGQDLLAQRLEIVVDLKDALRAYKNFGLHSSLADHTTVFTF